MNKFRLDLVLAVFAKLDKNRNGFIEIDDILGDLELKVIFLIVFI